MADEITDEEMNSWLEKVIQNENIKEYTYEVESTKNHLGFMGNVVFVNVKGSTSDGEVKDLHLVVKFGKKSRDLREQLSWTDYYARELFFYSTVVPSFEIFQANRKIKDVFDNVPKCYATLYLDGMEVIILENLQIKGFELHDKSTSMNQNHIEMILDRMARFHSISFCYQDQNKEEFDLIFGNYDSLNGSEIRSLEAVMLKLKNNVYEALKQTDLELAEEFKVKFRDDMWDVFKSVLKDDVVEKVVTHCDCWNNNYLFKYEDEKKDSPSNLIILDWQLSNLHSPVFDLAEIFYAVATDKLPQYKYYLEFYHQRLSKYIKNLGSNPENLFPFSTLIEHWKKYSCYGLMKTLAFLNLMVCNDESASSYNNMTPDDFVQEMRMAKQKTFNDLYYSRLTCIIRHYCEEY